MAVSTPILGLVSSQDAMAVSTPIIVSPHDADNTLLTCSICCLRYRIPKVLPCLHSFCQQCLEEYIPSESLSITCPTCRQQSILPKTGIPGLQNNFFITNLLDLQKPPEHCAHCDTMASLSHKCAACVDYFCPQCAEDHTRASTPDAHEMFSIGMGEEGYRNGVSGGEQQPLPCSNHDGEALVYYCMQCETAVCEQCVSKEHISHSTVHLRDVVDDQKHSLQNLLETSKDRTPLLVEAKKTIDDVIRQLDSKKSRGVNDVVRAFDQLERTVKQRRNELLGELDRMYACKVTTLTKQRTRLEDCIEDIRKTCEFTERSMEQGNETQVILIKKQMSERLKHLSLMDVEMRAEENTFLECSAGDYVGILKSIEGLGSVESNSAVAHHTTASGEALRRCLVASDSVITVTTKNHLEEIVTSNNAVVTGYLRHVDGNSHPVEICDGRNGQYEVKFSANTEGEHELHLKLFNRVIGGSPFRINAVAGLTSPDSSSDCKLPKMNVRQKGFKRLSSSVGSKTNRNSNCPIEDDLLLRIGTRGRNKGEFSNPQGIGLHDGKMYITDSNNQCVQVFTAVGEFRQRFGVRGRNIGQMQRPTGIVVAENGNIFVADYENKVVSVFSPELKFLRKIGAGKLIGPKGLVIDHNGHLVVVDNKTSCVFVFQQNGKLIQKFGTRGSEEHQFCGPHFIAVDSSNAMIITDFHNHSVKVFNSEGTFQFKFGSHGEGNGQFNAPTGVAVDTTGNIIVADWGNSRIQVFDCSGSFLSYINTTGDPLYGPQGIAVTADSNIVVADSGNHCVKIYKYLQ